MNFQPVNKLRIDGHDVIMISDDHFIIYSGYPETSGNLPGYLLAAPNTRVITPVIEEVKDGKIIWQWDAGKFPEFYANSFFSNTFSDTGKTLDPIHMNSMSLDPCDSNLVLSLVNLNQVVKISRKTGEILWRLGGRNSDFAIPTDLIFAGQHHVTVCGPGPTILMLDDSPTPWRKRSRVLEFVLDEHLKKIVSTKSTRIIERNAQRRGSVQIVGDDYIIGGGCGKFATVVGRNDHRKKMVMYMNQQSYRVYYADAVPGLK